MGRGLSVLVICKWSMMLLNYCWRSHGMVHVDSGVRIDMQDWDGIFCLIFITWFEDVVAKRPIGISLGSTSDDNLLATQFDLCMVWLMKLSKQTSIYYVMYYRIYWMPIYLCHTFKKWIVTKHNQYEHWGLWFIMPRDLNQQKMVPGHKIYGFFPSLHGHCATLVRCV